MAGGKTRPSSWRAMLASASLTLALAASPCPAQRWKSSPQKHEPPPRENKLPQAKPANKPQGHAGDWLRRYKDLPPEQQQKALENDPQFRKLPPERQQQLRQRLLHFSHLPPEQQQRMLNRMETWEHLTPEQKQHARQVFGQLKQLPPQRRQVVTEGIRQLRAMSPDQRQQVINSEQYKSQFSPQERDLMSNAVKLPLAPTEGPKSEGAGEPEE